MQNGWIQDGTIQGGRIQDVCQHQVNQIELVWVRVRVEWECFWVNLKEDNKVSESKMAVAEYKMAELKMATIINESEWMSEFFLCANGGNQSWQMWVILRGKTKMAESKMFKFKMVEFKMATIIKLSQNEWVKFFSLQMVGTNLGKCEWVWEEKLRWLKPIWHNSRWLPSSGWVKMN